MVELIKGIMFTKAVNDKTPIETWCVKKPSAKHLRVFGSIFYIHVPSQKRRKLEDKSIHGIFLGYSTQSRGYRVYNLQTKKIIVSRDIEVDEDASWNWDEDKVEKSNITIPIPQSDTEDIAGTNEEKGIPRSPPQKETSSLESTPTRVGSLVDIYMKLATWQNKMSQVI